MADLSEECAPPVAEGLTSKGSWCVADRTPDGGALDVLACRCKWNADGVDLGECVFAGRLRGEAWVSTIGAPGADTPRDVTGWALKNGAGAWTPYPPPALSG